MRRLLACTCLTPAFLALLSPAGRAETVISTKVTSPVATATANQGTADDIRIASAGTVAPAAGNAVTVDSDNDVKNEGTIQFTGVSNATGILVNPGTAGTITNAGTGKIVLDEDFTPTDGDNDGDLDGPFAQGSNRFGIRLAPGGTFTGNIVNGGSIRIEGNASAGIAADSRLAGSLTNGGTIDMLGDNSAGIRAGEVTGNVRIEGSVSARGANSVGVALDGDIGGRLTVQGAIGSTGYRATTPPANTSKLDADDLLQGGPALRVAGSVAGGILLDAPPPDLNADDKDEDDDGVEDSKEATASISSLGAAPAVQIGAAGRDLAIGAVAGAANNGHGIVINGNVTGVGVYNDVAASGIVVGGQGGAVNVTGGMTVRGTVRAESNGASATAIRIGNGASVDELRVSGTVAAAGGNAAADLSRAILIDEQAVVTTVRNSGSIAASTAGDGKAAAIVDRSGRVTLVENSGRIAAAGAPAGSDRGTAIDLSQNVTGATVRQTQVGQGVAVPQINGNILFGAGSDLLEIGDGIVAGTTRFGAGDNRLTLAGDGVYQGAILFGAGADRLSLAGTSAFSGSADFGGGADRLELAGTARFRGSLANSGGLAVQLDGGSFAATNVGTVALASIATTGESAIGVTVDGAASANTLYHVAGTAAFGQGARVQVTLANISEAEGSYTFLRAGTLTGAGNVAFDAETLPFLFKGALAANPAANEMAVVISRKSATELGLNGSEGRAYGAVFDVLDADEDMADVFLGLATADSFRSTLQQMLPDHAGGAFDTVTQGSRTTARFLGDPRAPLADHGRFGYWIQQVAWGSSKDLGDTAAYDISGWGAAGGLELIAGAAGSFGLSIAYLAGEDEDGETDNQVRADQYELGAYWRARWGGLSAWARGSAAMIGFDSLRTFTGAGGGQAVTRTARGEGDGQLYSAAAGLAYEFQTGRLSLRPAASVDYYRLSEDGYAESGGGDAFDLVVEERTSDELAGTASLTAGYDFGDRRDGTNWLRVELEGGRRQILGGELGATVARFGDGDAFTLLPEDRESGWLGRLRLVGGSPGFTLGGEASAEEQHGEAAIAFRVSLQIGI